MPSVFVNLVKPQNRAPEGTRRTAVYSLDCKAAMMQPRKYHDRTLSVAVKSQAD